MTDETLIDVPAPLQAEAAVPDAPEQTEPDSIADTLEAQGAIEGEAAEESAVESTPGEAVLVASVDLGEVKRMVEAALLVAGEPVPISQLSRLFEPPLETDIVRTALDDLAADWSDRAIELVQVASGWRFQGKPSIQRSLDRLTPEKPPRYSRAVMETLAIIAYQQPVTRGDIEAIRGVAVSTNVIKTLEDRSWVEIVGHRETPGRPALYATTKTFLDDLGLRSLSELPPLAELDASHLLETPDAPTKAAEARLALASPILAPPADESDATAEPGAATDSGDGAGSPQVVH